MVELPSGEVSVSDLTKRYGSLEAVRSVGFDIHRGEIFGLLGPNGAGKTTTLECLLGLRRPDSGSLWIAGIDVLAHPAQVRQIVGAQLQTAALQDKITTREALQLLASFYPAPLSVDALLERFRLTDKARSTFESLSGGQKQRLLLALAFVNNPRVLVLDEPTAGLDPQSRRELHDLIIGLRADGRTIILSTHLIDEAHRVCDRIGILHQGKIITVATPAALIAQARTEPRITVQTVQPLRLSAAATLPGVTEATADATATILYSNDISRTITGVVELIARERTTLVDLHIHRPSLEDVFLELTGTTFDRATPVAQSAPRIR